MGIAADDIARVRAASDFVSIAGEHLALKRVGRRYQGLCPFHSEKTPSFSLNAEENVYYCFGCQARGDVITFVREIEHLDFAEAVERLAGRAGIELHRDDAASRQAHRRRRLVEAVGRAVEFYHRRLLEAPDAAAARSYLRSRGYGGDVVRRYKLGWAPDDWDALARELGLAEDVLRQSGLGFVNRVGRQQDSFRARVMFPVFDAAGEPVGFGGRSLPGGPQPKYKNSAESAIYSKSRLLYALNWVKADIVRAGEAVVCEGYTDAIAFAQAGVPRAVATCGTALTEDHVRVLKNFAPRVVLAYDADAAGRAAAERFYEWEQRYQLDITVADLPRGSDPADLALRRPEALSEAVEKARPFLAFRLDRVLEQASLGTPEGRARAAQAALAAIAEHPSDLVRDQYVMKVADWCRIDAARLRAQLERLRRERQGSTNGDRAAGRRGRPEQAPAANGRGPSAGRSAPSRRAQVASPPPGPELEALKLAVHRGAEVEGRLHEVLFGDPLMASTYRVLAGSRDLHEAIERAEPDSAELLLRLAADDTDADAEDVVRLVTLGAVGRALAEIDAEQRQSDDPLAYAPIVDWLTGLRRQLAEPELAPGVTAALVPWLLDRLQVEE